MNRLDKIEARANAATEGPWSVFHGKRCGTYVTRPDLAGVAREWSLTWSDADAEFIAATRTDVPALVEALRAVLNLHFKAQPIPAAFGTQEGGDYCVTCAEDWPCPTVETIRQHLGEDA